jgi:hypothetical protein
MRRNSLEFCWEDSNDPLYIFALGSIALRSLSSSDIWAKEAVQEISMKIRLVSVVWGDFFVDIFLRVTVRSLLATGNAPELAQRHSVIYTLQTTAEDKRV